MRPSLKYPWLAAAGLLLLSAAGGESGATSAPAAPAGGGGTDSCLASAGLSRGAVADHGSATATSAEL